MTLTAPTKRSGSRRAEHRPPPVVVSLGPTAGSPWRADHLPERLGGRAGLGAALLLFVGLVLQRTVLSYLPWGPADLVTVLVAALAIFAGPAAGCLGGFGIGLLADILSDHALGRLAAVLCVVGYGCGLLAVSARQRLWAAWLTLAGAAVVTPLLFALTGAFARDTRAAGMLLFSRCVAGLCYGLLLAPFAYPLTRRLLSSRMSRALRRRAR